MKRKLNMNAALDWPSLEIGKTYFLLGYHDSKRLYPFIETLVYIGVDDQDNAVRKLHIFEYAEPHLAKAEESDTLQFSDADPSCVGNLDGLIQELKSLQLRQKK
jgi:hypothetical protein